MRMSLDRARHVRHLIEVQRRGKHLEANVRDRTAKLLVGFENRQRGTLAVVAYWHLAAYGYETAVGRFQGISGHPFGKRKFPLMTLAVL